MVKITLEEDQVIATKKHSDVCDAEHFVMCFALHDTTILPNSMAVITVYFHEFPSELHHSKYIATLLVVPSNHLKLKVDIKMNLTKKLNYFNAAIHNRSNVSVHFAADESIIVLTPSSQCE